MIFIPSVLDYSLLNIIILAALLIANIAQSIWFAWHNYYELLKPFWESVFAGVINFIFVPIIISIPIIIIFIIMQYALGIDFGFSLVYSLP